ncbi:chemotaxis protein CheW [Ancylobacter pratisalsi]|uniref:Chemotaxis protein CheW n=1 Tax=Ancylobacter pratisalsi TaxID=1745854 RepID=A0A6P1YN37_9HYPH|nr:chemotaxis protein CheW [Ancylobacter pratisalsi]QIB34545.1 chemotaxis protein CheW [Ancylobacter pratisalsi]
MLLLPFTIDQSRMALPFDRVVRVEPMVAPLPLPRPIPNVVGGMVYHGNFVPLYGLRSKLGCNQKHTSADDCIVMTQAGGAMIGVIADEVSAVIEVSTDSISDYTLERGEIVAGATIVGDNLVLITNLDRFLSDDEKLELDAIRREFAG